MKKHILAVCLNPTFQRTIVLNNLNRGEVNRSQTARLDASGKGVNAARVLNQLGACAVHLTHLTDNKSKREEFLSLCRQDNLDVIWTGSSSPIRTCITLLDTRDNSTTEIIEPTLPVEEKTVDEIRKLFTNQLEKSSHVILSGSKAPGYPDNLFADFCSQAKKAGVPVTADFRGEDLLQSLPHNPQVVKINLVEFCATFLKELTVSENDDSGVLDLVKAKLKELSAEGSSFVLTRGSRNILCAEKGKVMEIPVEKVVPVNTIGSGDAFAAGMTFALSRQASLTEAVKKGMECGAKNAMLLKPGSIKK